VSRPALKLAALAVIAAIAFSACTSVGEPGGIDVAARFADVGDLAPGAPVMMADITIGHVSSIGLSGDRALVHMSIEQSARVPADVIAVISRTSLLGEKIVELDVPSTSPAGAALLRDGGMIQDTQVRPDLEDLVRSGSNVLAPIAAGEISTLVNEGAKGFGGQGQNLKTLLDNFHAIVHAYAGRTTQIESVISAQAESIANSAKALGVLRSESDRLITAVTALVRLAKGARAILDAHSAQMIRFFAQMHAILGVLRSEQSSIAGALRWAPFHNRNTQLVEYQQFNQVLQDFIFCGMNDSPTDPARKCYNAPPPPVGSGGAQP
jgi:virulence factor Mce-like protein